MSIGKRLLELRQKRSLSQEDLANQLHVSRQTISKWESDLSLPDIKLMLVIAEFYQVSITDLLGIDEPQNKNSIEHIYEQTNIVLDNIQSETKKRHKRDLIVMCGICITCFLLIIVTIVLVFKISDLQNRVIVEHEYINSNETEASIISSFNMNKETMIYDLTKQTVNVHFICKLNEYTEKTTVKLQFIDNNEKSYNFDMVKKSDNTFEYEGDIPFVDYSQKEIIIDLGGKVKTETLYGDDMISLNEIVRQLIHLQIPKDEDGKLYRNRVVLYMDFSNLTADLQKRVKGQLKATARISIEKEYRSFSTNVLPLYDDEVNLEKKQTLNLAAYLSVRDKVNCRIIVYVNGEEILVAGNSTIIVEEPLNSNPFELIRLDAEDPSQ